MALDCGIMADNVTVLRLANGCVQSCLECHSPRQKKPAKTKRVDDMLCDLSARLSGANADARRARE